jgi:hypothetical protein
MTKKRHNWLTALFVAVVTLLSLNPVFAFSNCPESHCSRVSTQLNEACKAAGYSHGAPFPVVRGDKSVCMCPCSCVTGDTLILLANGKVKRADELVEGDLIMVMTASGLQSTPIYLVTRSSVTLHKLQKVTLSDGSALTASNNHTVLNEYDQLVTLDSVAIGSKLRRYDGELVEVLSNDKVTKERVDLINVMVNIDSSVPLQHVYVTNGLLSGDMLVQLTRDVTGEDIDLLWDKIDLSNVPPKK